MSARPRSIVSSVTWLVGGVAAFSLLLHLAVMYLWVEPFSDDLVNVMVSRARLSRQLLQQAPQQQRPAVATGLSQDRFRVQRSSEPWPVMEAKPSLNISEPALRKLQRFTHDEFKISFAPLGDGFVQFDFVLDGDYWRISYGAQPPISALLGTGLGWLTLVALAVFFSLAAGVRLITRPMSELAQYLSSQGDLLRPLSMPANAAAEIVALVTSFNALVEAIHKADETKQHLLAGVSHDLRTPLSRLHLRIETQCEGKVADELLSDLTAVERIVSQFLAYVQGDKRAALGEIESVAALMPQVVASYQEQGHSVQARPTDMELHLPDVAIHRVLGNLIDNALAYGGTPVEVTLTQEGESGAGHAVLTVWDHGKGLDKLSFERAQLPFVRLESSKGQVGQCGLGLAIVARIAEQLGADLRQERDDSGRFGVSLVLPLSRAVQK